MSKYLSLSGTTLDCVLTKKGKELLAQNNNILNITHFAFGDDEIDYGLLPDQDRINGTPILQGISDTNAGLTHRLVTEKNVKVTKLPSLNVSPPEIKMVRGRSAVVELTTLNGSDLKNQKPNYTVINPSPSLLTIISPKAEELFPAGPAWDHIYEDGAIQKIRCGRSRNKGVIVIEALSAFDANINLTIQGEESGVRGALTIQAILSSSTGLSGTTRTEEDEENSLAS